MLNGLSDRQERLERVRRHLTTLINGGSLKGAAAKASNQYLQEVYLQGLLKSFDETIENLKQVLAQYIGGYTSVDPGPDFYLSDEEYDNLNDKIKSQFHKADRVLDGLVSAGNKVSDLLPGSHLTDMQMDGDLTVADLHSELPHIIDDQQDAWANYEKSSEELTKNADLLLQDIGHVIGQYMGQPAVRMNGYVTGSFRQMLGAKLLADTAQVNQVDQSNAHVVRQYAKLLKDQWKSHVAYVKKVLQAKREEMKKQGWVNLLFEAVDTVIAAAATIGPLLAGLALAATVAFPAGRIVGDLGQAITSKDAVKFDPIQGWFNKRFGEKMVLSHTK